LLNEKLPYGNAPSSSRLTAFIAKWESTNQGTKACEATPADFMIHLAGDPKSPWNVSAGRVFADYLIKKTGRDDTPEMRKSIEKAFITRVKSLKCQLKRDALPQAEKSAERSKHSRKQRKYEVRF
jgi:hypothetical protein